MPCGTTLTTGLTTTTTGPYVSSDLISKKGGKLTEFDFKEEIKDGWGPIEMCMECKSINDLKVFH